MDFQLSLLSHVELQHLKNELRFLNEKNVQHCKEVSKAYRKGISKGCTSDVIDFLALEDPSVKKTNQKCEQRLKDKHLGIARGKKPINLRSSRAVCKLRAKRWLKMSHFIPGIDSLATGEGRAWMRTVVDRTKNRKSTFGFAHNGGFEKVNVLTTELVPLNTCDSKDQAWSGYRDGRAKEDVVAGQLCLRLPVDLSVSKSFLSKPVPEPTPLVTGWKKGKVQH